MRLRGSREGLVFEIVRSGADRRTLCRTAFRATLQELRRVLLRTAPRLPGGTPFPTSYYATCPRLTGPISTLESSGLMAEMSQRLLEDEDLAARYRAAHEDYLARRAELGDVPEIDGISAGGMPTRVKCLHVLVAHSLAAGPGVNPLGDEALDLLTEWWHTSPCVGTDEGSER